jgi:S-DNA-T family DNA segregation ATPase FtsK/SpoIIIE
MFWRVRLKRQPPPAQPTNRLPTAVSGHVARGLKEGELIAFGALTLYLIIALYSYNPADPSWSYTGSANAHINNAAGKTGAYAADVLLSLFGYLAYLFPAILAYKSWRIFRDREIERQWHWSIVWLRGLGLVVTLIAGSALAHLHMASGHMPLPADAGSGGWLGKMIMIEAEPAFGKIGSTLIFFALFLSGLTVFTNLSWFGLMDLVGKHTINFCSFAFTSLKDRHKKNAVESEAQKLREFRQAAFDKIIAKEEKRIPPTIAPPPKKVETSARLEKERNSNLNLFNPKIIGELPPITLLDQPDRSIVRGFSKESLEGLSKLLEIKLNDFGIQVEVVSVHPGPVVTRFEIQPAAGVKVSRITNLAKDLARSLAVISVRVVEVIPGKSVVGIEIPNEDREIVRLSEVISSKEYDTSGSPLTLVLGKDISGVPIVVDLTKMPHLLIAGTTGSGKSVGVNAMLLSLLFKSSPEDVRLIMIDPKMLELSVYDGIPHLLTPVVTDMKDAANALRWCVAEMDRRYRLMAALGVRNLVGYNRKVKDAMQAKEPISDPLWKPSLTGDTEAPMLQPLPYVVVVVDEFADMMMIVGKKVEELITRIAQKARAAGIHLILATQRPSVDVITGLIKANVPTRVAFQVSSKVDSRTILDQGGAEQLLGHGDMLYLPPGTSLPIRVHGAFVSDEEVHRVVADWKKRGEPTYIEEIIAGSGESDSSMGSSQEDSEQDPLYDEAVQFVLQTRRASISSVQRRLKIGYNRAARMIEAMEMAGVVTEMGTNGNREVLAPPPHE